MNLYTLFDYLLITVAIMFSWRMYAAHPPPSDTAEADPKPVAAHPVAARSSVAAVPTIAGPVAMQEALQRICAIAGYPDISAFLERARLAYEEIFAAFADGNIEPHAHLLAPVVEAAFAAAIAARQARHETMSLMFIGFRSADLAGAGIDGTVAWIDVRFVAQMVLVTRDGEGRVVAGDPTRVVELAELWTFERDLRSADPAWLLAATDTDA